MEIKDLQNKWNIYRSIEHDLKNTALYVEPEGQEEVYSIAFSKIIINAATLVENCMKELCKIYDCDSSRGNMSDYKKVILGHNSHITEASVFVVRLRKDIKPFDNWNNDSLKWWDDYNEIKHGGADSIKKATCINAIIITAAAYILLLYLEEVSDVNATFEDISDYYNCEYVPQRFLVAKRKSLPGIRKVQRQYL